MNNEQIELENLILAHRYLYYVWMAPVLTDRDYDILEMRAMGSLPDHSVVHDLGSSNPDDYSDEVKELAKQLTKTKREL